MGSSCINVQVLMHAMLQRSSREVQSVGVKVMCVVCVCVRERERAEYLEVLLWSIGIA